MIKGRDREKDGMSMIIINYNDKIIRKQNNFIPTLQQVSSCVVHILSIKILFSIILTRTTAA